LREAMRKVVGDIKVEDERLRTECAAPDKAKGVLAKTAEVIDKTAKVCDSLDKIKKFGEGAWSLAGAVGRWCCPTSASSPRADPLHAVSGQQWSDQSLAEVQIGRQAPIRASVERPDLTDY